MLAGNSSAMVEALKRCEHEPIQFIGDIQSHGVLLAVDAHSRVQVASDNIIALLGLAALQALKQPVESVIGEAAWAAIAALTIPAQQNEPLPITLPLYHGAARVDCQAQVHRADDLLVIEIEIPTRTPRDIALIDFDSIDKLLSALLADINNLDAYAAVIAHQVRASTGFDRVMVYQFDHQWNGKVIAESRKSGVASFLGNHFPASDIPPPARALFTRNLARIMVDRDAPAIPLLHSNSLPLQRSLDLSFSVLRSMSPVHLEYLKNLGVRASLTVSLLQNGRLWGLIACHHETPRQLPFKLRQSMELVAKTVATRLAAIAFAEGNRYHALVSDILPRLAGLTGLVESTAAESLLSEAMQQEVLHLVHATGAVIVLGEHSTCIGTTPTPDQVQELLAWLRPRLVLNNMLITHSLATDYRPASAFANVASGLLAIRLDDQAERCLLWMREEVVRSTSWAGEASKHLVEDDHGPKLEPRRSFERWVQTMRGESPYWSNPEVEAARLLSLTLAERFSRQQLRMAEQSKRLAASVYENSSEAMVVTDANNIILNVNPAFSALTGYSPAEAIGQTPGLLRSGRHDQAFYARLWTQLQKNGVWSGEVWNRRKNGEVYPEWLSINSVYDDTGALHRRVALFTDITERVRAEADLRIAATAFESQEGMTVTNAEGTILRVNQAFTQITGYSAEEVVGRNPRLLHSGRQDPAFYTEMWARIQRCGSWQGDIWNRRKDGEAYYGWLSITAVTGASDQVTHYVGTFTDMTDRKQDAEKIERLAFYDHLTQLPNRRLMLDRLGQAVVNVTRRQRQGAVMMIDLDNFKALNDTMGHAVGDVLLVEAASRLLACVRAGDSVARPGGDEFVVILEDLGERDQAVLQAEVVGEKILASLGLPYPLDVDSQGTGTGPLRYVCTSSIGVALFSDLTVSADELIKRADTAMYQAKAAGRNTLRFFDPDMQAAVQARAALEVDLRRAIKHGQFLLHFQSQVDARGKIQGAETLVRWQHPVRGLISPTEFIPLAEETGLILPLGQWVLQTACQQLASWANLPATAHLTLAVNVSARQFGLPDFVDLVLSTVRQSGARLDRLKLELTESLLLTNAEDIVGKMTALKSHGVYFSLDDFGTGYSSLSYLKHLPLDQLKIDQSFVRDIVSDPQDAAIAKTIVTLGQNLGMTVIAEGVETIGQRNVLAGLGCLNYQGYFFSRPVPLGVFEALLTDKPRQQTDSVPDLHQRLRQATKQPHHVLDHHLVLAPLIRPEVTLAQYGDALAALHGVQCRAETSILAFLAQHPNLFDYTQRRKLSALESDLAALGRHPQPLTVRLPTLHNQGALTGVLYTLEGATQGGRFIARNLHQSALPPEVRHATSFFDIYGEQSQQRWNEFLAFARQCPLDQHDAAVATAVAMFKAIEQQMDGCLPEAQPNGPKRQGRRIKVKTSD
ncbi:MAG: EAL domain-containing protein [Comamonadaceae bacterium]|nr:EAL domain-containing protein [Comamonadaceae bacterium]